MVYEDPIDQRICGHFSVRTSVIFAGIWRGILGAKLFVFGAVLLHYNEHAAYTIPYGLLARHIDVKEVLPGPVLCWAVGYCIGGLLELLINVIILYYTVTNTHTRPLLLKWIIGSAILCALYVAVVLYQICAFEVKRQNHNWTHNAHLEFIFFCAPILGEVIHMYFILIVKCMHRDMKPCPRVVVPLQVTYRQVVIKTY